MVFRLLGILLLTLVSTSVPSATAWGPMDDTRHSVYLPFVRGPVRLPSTHIAFASRHLQTAHISVMKADGSERVSLTDPASGVNEGEGPVWSPNGRTLAFLNANSEIVVVNVDGSGLINLTTSSDGPARYPTWSPRGDRLAFANGNLIELINADGTGRSLLIDTKLSIIDGIRSLQWSPDGTTLAFTACRSGYRSVDCSFIDVVNADGLGHTILATSLQGNIYDLVWSPDGRKLAFTSDDLFVINADGSGRINLTNTPGTYERRPAWSPYGSKLAFMSAFDIYVIDSDGTGLINLTNTPAENEQSPTWSRDGSKLAFVSAGDIYVMNTDGSGRINLTNTPLDAEETPVWSP